MPYFKLYYHIVFRTRQSVRALDAEHDPDLYNYIWGVCKSCGSFLYRVNGIEDHIHLLVEISPSLSLSDFVKKIKLSTSAWIYDHKEWYPRFEGWSKGYCALTYSMAERDSVIEYIRNQKIHHGRRQVSFEDELRELMQRAGVEYDEQYLTRNV